MENHSSTRYPSTVHPDYRPNGTDHVEFKPDGPHFSEPPPINESQERPHSQQGTTFLRNVLNLINTLSGIGIISIPYAISEGGWLSLILLILVAMISCYTAILLRRCMDPDPEIKTYPDIGERAFGPKGKVAIALFTYFELYLVCVEFLILEGDNLSKLFPKMDFKIKGLKIGGRRGFVILSALIILPTTWLRSLRLLAYVSTWGVLTSLIVVACVFWVGAFDGVGFHAKGTLCNLRGFPTAMSLIIFCYSGHPVFPTIYTSMKDKRQFSEMFILCFILCTIIYGTMGILGYLMFGKATKSQITLNLPTKKISSIIATYTTVISPFAKYALLMTPVAMAIENKLHISNNRSTSLLMRTLLMISTVIVALTVPLFAYVMALIGSFLDSMVGMVFPCICYLKICKASYKASRYGQLEVVIIIGIIVIGALLATVGTYNALRQIVRHL